LLAIKNLLLLVACLLWFSANGQAAGKILPEDFSYRGVCLGDSEAKMKECLGEPMYNLPRSVLGVAVIYHAYRDDLTVGVLSGERKVVEIIDKGEKYAARGGIRHGATTYKITQVYGQTEKRLIDGYVSYIYENPARPRERLILTIEPERGGLKAFRLTGLPLTEEEANSWVEEARQNNDEDTLALFTAKDGGIDLSALPPDKPVRLRRPE